MYTDRLLAQRGLFTVMSYRDRNPQHGMHPPLNREIERLAGASQDVIGEEDKPLLWKIELATEHVSSLLKKLSFDEVDAATLFPGYAGVAKSVIEELEVSVNVHKRTPAS